MFLLLLWMIDVVRGCYVEAMVRRIYGHIRDGRSLLMWLLWGVHIDGDLRRMVMSIECSVTLRPVWMRNRVLCGVVEGTSRPGVTWPVRGAEEANDGCGFPGTVSPGTETREDDSGVPGTALRSVLYCGSTVLLDGGPNNG
jgi:hypothetical protein